MKTQYLGITNMFFTLAVLSATGAVVPLDGWSDTVDAFITPDIPDTVDALSPDSSADAADAGTQHFILPDIFPSSVSAGSLFEVRGRIDLPIDNPFDPGEVTLDLDAQLPDGTVITHPGFFFQDFYHDLIDGHDVRVEQGDPAWVTRFTPRFEGDWNLSTKMRHHPTKI